MSFVASGIEFSDENSEDDDISVDSEFDEEIQNCLSALNEDDDLELILDSNEKNKSKDDAYYDSDDSAKTVILPVEKQYKNYNALSKNITNCKENIETTLSSRVETTYVSNQHCESLFSRRSRPVSHSYKLEKSSLQEQSTKSNFISFKSCSSAAACELTLTPKSWHESEATPTKSTDALSNNLESKDSEEIPCDVKQKSVQCIAKLVQKLLAEGKNNPSLSCNMDATNQTLSSSSSRIEQGNLEDRKSFTMEWITNSASFSAPKMKFDHQDFSEPLNSSVDHEKNTESSTTSNQGFNYDSEGTNHPEDLYFDFINNKVKGLEACSLSHKKSRKKNKIIQRMNSVIVPAVEEFSVIISKDESLVAKDTDKRGRLQNSHSFKGNSQKIPTNKLENEDSQDFSTINERSSSPVSESSLKMSVNIIHELLEVLYQCKKCFTPKEFKRLLDSHKVLLKHLMLLKESKNILLDETCGEKISALLLYHQNCAHKMKKRKRKYEEKVKSIQRLEPKESLEKVVIDHIKYSIKDKREKF